MKDTDSIFIIGTLSREDEIQKAAMYYLYLGYSVRIVRKQPDIEQEALIIDCLKNIDKCDKVIAIPHEDGTLGTGTLYETAYAQKIGKEVEIW